MDDINLSITGLDQKLFQIEEQVDQSEAIMATICLELKMDLQEEKDRMTAVCKDPEATRDQKAYLVNIRRMLLVLNHLDVVSTLHRMGEAARLCHTHTNAKVHAAAVK